MTIIHNIPFICLFLALLSALVLPLIANQRRALYTVLAVQLAVVVLSAVLLAELWHTGESFTYQMGHVSAPWGNELKAGPLEALLALVFSMVMLLSMAGGAADARRDIKPERQGGYFLLMQLLYAALLAMVYTNDLFTAYVFIEIMAITACIAVVIKESGRSVISAIRYLIFSCLGSGLVLLSISILYAVTGHLLMEDLGQTLAELATQGRYTFALTAAALLMTVGLSIKSAQFPFHAWLPDAHASATTSASAILSGLVLKGYLVLLIKLAVRVFGSTLLLGIYMYDLLFFLGLSGMLFASVAALRQEEVKGMIAYSSSAQISYIFLAIGLGSRTGLAAACFQIICHAFTKSMIFISAGALIRAGNGGHHWSDLRGCARRDPVAGIGFTVGGLSLCGLPLLAGFSAKYALAVSALSEQWQTMPALFGLAASSVLNAMYYIPAILAIWGPARGAEQPVECPRSEMREHQMAIGFLLVCNIVLGVAVGPMLALITRGLELL